VNSDDIIDAEGMEGEPTEVPVTDPTRVTLVTLDVMLMTVP
jgi:hypothetical protein